MASSDRSFGERQAVRRQLVMMAGILILVLIVIDVVALYGLDRIRRQSDRYVAATDELIAVTELAGEAEVAFKTQVQEWKNVLLRGQDPEDLARYREAFDQQEAAVQDTLRQVREQAGPLGLSTEAVDKVLTMHAELAERYDAALETFEPGTPESAWQVDRSVRGMDRPLTEAFDALLADVRSLAANARTEVRVEMAEAAETQRTILIVAHAAGIALVLISLLVALRALRRR